MRNFYPSGPAVTLLPAAKLCRPGVVRVVAIVATSLVWTASLRAEGPAFDRPGIGFSPTVLPRGGFAWEQGLPDYFRNDSDGVTEKLYSASSRARFGVTDRWEIQAAAPLYARLEIDGSDGDSSVSGIGDLAVAAKVQLTSGEGRFNAGLLGTVVFPTGKEELSLGTELYSLGGSVDWALSDSQSLAFYANVDVLDGDAFWIVSPSWSYSLTENLSGYIEYGYVFAAHGEPADQSAGVGITWMVAENIQLDIYGLWGLTSESLDATMGCGFSIFVP